MQNNNNEIGKYIFFYVEDIWDLLKLRLILFVNFIVLITCCIFLFNLLVSLFPIKNTVIYSHLIKKEDTNAFNLNLLEDLDYFDNNFKVTKLNLAKIKKLENITTITSLNLSIINEIIEQYIIAENQYIDKITYLKQLRFLANHSSDKIANIYQSYIYKMQYDMQDIEFTLRQESYVNILENICNIKKCIAKFEIIDNKTATKQIKNAIVEFDFDIFAFFNNDLTQNELILKDNYQKKLNFKVIKYIAK